MDSDTYQLGRIRLYCRSGRPERVFWTLCVTQQISRALQSPNTHILFPEIDTLRIKSNSVPVKALDADDGLSTHSITTFLILTDSLQ